MIFIPKEGDIYYHLTDSGIILNTINVKHYSDTHRIKSSNCYRTEEDAIKSSERQYAKRELEVLADELNGGVDIDWNDGDQYKYCLVYLNNRMDDWVDEKIKRQGTTYSLSPNFLEEALKRLGEAKLRMILEVE